MRDNFDKTLMAISVVLALVVSALFLARKRTPDKPDHVVVTNSWVIPLINIVEGSTIDASRGMEFALALSRDTVARIINIRDGQPVTLIVTNAADHALTFTNEVTWLPRGSVPKAGANGLTMFSFYRIGGELFGNVSYQTTIMVTNVGTFTFEFPKDE